MTRRAAEENSFPLDELQIDLTILPEFPIITLPVRDAFHIAGVAEGVHLIQRIVGLGEIDLEEFEPMKDSDLTAEALVDSTTKTRMFDLKRYVRDKFEIQEKEWVNRFFEEKYGNDNPYSDFYTTFVEAGK